MVLALPRSTHRLGREEQERSQEEDDGKGNGKEGREEDQGSKVCDEVKILLISQEITTQLSKPLVKLVLSLFIYCALNKTEKF